MSERPLKPCPFCGCNMETEAGTWNKKREPLSLRHPANDCLLSGYVWGLHSHEHQWNRRDNPTKET